MQSRNKPPSASIFRSHLFRLYVGVTVLILIVVATALLTLTQLRDAAENRAIATTKSMAKSVELTINGLIDTLNVALLTSAEEITEQMSAGKADAKFMDGFLMKQKERLGYADFLRATNERGDSLYGSGTMQSAVNIADRDYFIRLKNDPHAELVISKPIVSRIDGKWVWVFARRINKPDGSFGGVIYSSLSIDDLHKMFGQIKMGPANIITLRDANHVLVARYSTGKNFFPSDDVGVSTAFSSALTNNPDEGSYVSEVSKFDGRSHSYSYFRNPKYGFFVNAGIIRHEAFAEWRKQAWVVCGLVVAFALALLVFARLISRGWERHKADMAALQASQESLHEAQQIAHLGTYSYDLHTNQWTSSRILDDILGIGPDYERNLHGWLQLIVDESRQEMQSYLSNLIEPHLTLEREYRIIRLSDGQERWVHGKGQLQFDGDGTPIALVGVIQDITERKQSEAALRDSHETLQSILATTLDGYWCADAQGKILDVNQAYCKMSGYTREELLEMEISDLEAMETPFDTSERFQHIAKHGHAQFETRHCRKDGSILYLEASLTFRDADGGQVFAFMRDITERKRLQKELQQIATTDHLTGLINRRHFMELAHQEHRRAVRLRYHLAITLIDLDHLKPINDLHGHAVGDQALQTLARIIQQNIREIDVFARLGGDEFVLLLPGASSEQAYEIVERFRLALAAHTIELVGNAVSITISAGIANLSGDDDTFEQLMSRADQALYQSKAAGRNQVSIGHDLQ